jgi:GTPase
VLRPKALAAPVSVEREEDGAFRVVSRRVERWVAMLPVEEPDAARYLQGRMRRAGVETALIAAGARVGDTVVIGGVEFAFQPELDDLPPEEREAVLAGELDAMDLDDDLPEVVTSVVASTVSRGA